MINPQDLKNLVENYPKLVTAKRSKRYPELRVLKYTKKVFYDNLWNEHPLLVECRGLVVDDDYEVIVKPFTKTFNYQENGTTIERDELCTIVTKINGFMACVTPTEKYGTIVSTTGSLDSDFVGMAQEVLVNDIELLEIEEEDIGITYAFEIVHVDDPHIVPELIGSHLIGAQTTEEGWLSGQRDLDMDHTISNIGDHRPTWQENIQFSDAVKMVQTVQHEGYVVYGQTSGTVLKLKSPFYLVSKMFGRMGSEKLVKALNSGQPFKYIDEDFYPVVGYLKKNIEKFVAMDEQSKVKYVQDFLIEEVLK